MTIDRIKVGDRIRYHRHADGSWVEGRVVAVYRRDEATAQRRGSNVFRNDQLIHESVAYHLELSPEDQARVGHPVTVGGSRVELLP